MTDVQRFWLSFILIVACSGTMHVMVFGDKPPRHYDPVFQDPPKTQEGLLALRTITGEVAAISSYRFFLHSEGETTEFLIDRHAFAPPKPKSKIEVSYLPAPNPGSPPTAISFKEI